MKNRNLVLMCAVVFLYFFSTSCKKANDGAAGTSGTQGAQGTPGKPGVNGVDGATILSGDGAPAVTLGKDGDFYLDMTNMNFYGPKNSGGWGNGVSIKGSDGAAGSPGAPGAPGSQGPAGLPGGANAVVDAFSVLGSDWRANAEWYYPTGSNPVLDGSTFFFANAYNRNEPMLTDEFLASGMILIYMSSKNTIYPKTWTPLPFSFANPLSQTYEYNYVFVEGQGTLELCFYFSALNGTAPDAGSYTMPDLSFKVIMLPATIATQIKDIVHTRKQAPLN